MRGSGSADGTETLHDSADNVRELPSDGSELYRFTLMGFGFQALREFIAQAESYPCPIIGKAGCEPVQHSPVIERGLALWNKLLLVGTRGTTLSEREPPNHVVIVGSGHTI